MTEAQRKLIEKTLFRLAALAWLATAAGVLILIGGILVSSPGDITSKDLVQYGVEVILGPLALGLVLTWIWKFVKAGKKS